MVPSSQARNRSCPKTFHVLASQARLPRLLWVCGATSAWNLACLYFLDFHELRRSWRFFLAKRLCKIIQMLRIITYQLLWINKFFLVLIKNMIIFDNLGNNNLGFWVFEQKKNDLVPFGFMCECTHRNVKALTTCGLYHQYSMTQPHADSWLREYKSYWRQEVCESRNETTQNYFLIRHNHGIEALDLCTYHDCGDSVDCRNHRCFDHRPVLCVPSQRCRGWCIFIWWAQKRGCRRKLLRPATVSNFD